MLKVSLLRLGAAPRDLHINYSTPSSGTSLAEIYMLVCKASFDVTYKYAFNDVPVALFAPKSHGVNLMTRS